MKKEILLLLIIFLVQLVNAQDAHFSQMPLQTSFNNPGKVGMMSSDYKLVGSYRSQWASIPAPFRTYGLSFEQKLKKFSWGADILSNNAGAASLKQNNLRLKGAYQKDLSKSGNALRAGVAVGVMQQSFDPQAFEFDNQYEVGTGFNSQLGSRENFDKTTLTLPDISAGLILLNTVGKIKNEIGLSFSHINQPVASFYEDGTETYPMRTFFHIQSILPVKKNLSLKGQVQYAKQGTAKEIIFGGGIQYKLGPNKLWNIDLATRRGDAIIIATSLELKQAILAVSYDAHRSKLSGATSGNGAIELSATYLFNKMKISETPVTNVMEPERDFEVATKDSDNDGVPNGVDECPNIPGLWKYSGCNDKDEDGVYDSKDACPNLFGKKENQGCPMEAILDSDLDGLVDNIDDCPFLKGLPEHQGCPDTDKDGVSDKVDQCPFLKGAIKNKGCPLRAGGHNPMNVEEYMPKVNVEFDTDKAIIKPIYQSQLDEVVRYLGDNPEVNVYISGHTDGEGNAAYNHELGQKRSLEVMTYLQERGVRNSRMSIISYGETKPIHTNNNVYGKAKNRRAEVILVR